MKVLPVRATEARRPDGLLRQDGDFKVNEGSRVKRFDERADVAEAPRRLPQRMGSPYGRRPQEPHADWPWA